MSGTDLPGGYRWATAEETEAQNVPGAILVERTVDSTGVPYTQDEADVAVPLTRIRDAWDAVENLTSVAIRVTELEAKAALLAMALSARVTWPTATGIVLEDSDQGDYMCVTGVLDAGGNNRDDSEWGWDDEGAASHLYDNAAPTWQRYCEEREDGREWVVDIARVIAELGAHEVKTAPSEEALPHLESWTLTVDSPDSNSLTTSLHATEQDAIDSFVANHLDETDDYGDDPIAYATERAGYVIYITSHVVAA